MIAELHNAVSRATLAGVDRHLDASGISNQQILDAAKAAYAAYQPTVDASTLALVGVISSGALTSQITDLDGINWNSAGIDASVVDPVFSDATIAAAVAAAKTQMSAYSVGVYSNTLPDRTVGVAGFARALAGDAVDGLRVQLDLFQNAVETTLGSNLQLGQWFSAPSELHDNLVGLYIATLVQGVPVNLKILLDANLEPYGFMESTGARVVLPIQTSPFAGSTSSF